MVQSSSDLFEHDWVDRSVSSRADHGHTCTSGSRPRFRQPSAGCLREGAKSYAKVDHVLRWRRGFCTPVQVARTFSPCSRNCPCGPTYL